MGVLHVALGALAHIFRFRPGPHQVVQITVRLGLPLLKGLAQFLDARGRLLFRLSLLRRVRPLAVRIALIGRRCCGLLITHWTSSCWF